MIDTIVHLYMIVGLGIELKSMSVRSWKWTSLRLPGNPRFAARVLLKRANLSFVLYVCHDRCTWLLAFYSYFFFQSFVDSVAFSESGAISPVVIKTRGLNEDFSMSIILRSFHVISPKKTSLNPTILEFNEI